MHVERQKLVFMGLVALDEIADHCIHQPWHRAFTLRVTLAMLYAFSDGDRAPFDDLWRACAMSNGGQSEETLRKVERSSKVRGAFIRICRSLGVKQTRSFSRELSAARREPDSYQLAWEEHFPVIHDANDAERARFAEMLRLTGKATEEEKERQRRARECPLRG